MSKKHFQAFADRIRNIVDIKERKAAAIAVADVCRQFNPNFDTLQFILACGLVDPC
jgi:hypothetical protein